MPHREQYPERPACGAEVRTDGKKWTLLPVKELRHPQAEIPKRFAAARSLHG